MKLGWKREVLPAVLAAGMIVAGFYYYPLLPKSVPVHFGLQGQPNGWASKPFFFLENAGIFVGTYLLLTFLPFIDPLKRKIEPKIKTVLLIRDVLLVFTALIYFLAIESGLEGMLRVDYFGIAIGLLLVVIGNYMPKVPQNWFLGIRTPWAISSEVNWKKTHILGGWLFTICGILFIISASLKLKNTIPVFALMAAAVLTYIYSFVFYKRSEHSGEPSGTGQQP